MPASFFLIFNELKETWCSIFTAQAMQEINTAQLKVSENKILTKFKVKSLGGLTPEDIRIEIFFVLVTTTYMY